MAKALSYEELVEYARAHKGGYYLINRFDKSAFDEWVSLFGPITKKAALRLFREAREEERRELIRESLWW